VSNQDPGSTPEGCKNCGAPRQAGFAECTFCKTPFVANVAEQAIPCPKCKTLNAWGSQKCARCQSWVVVQCVFCHAISPHHLPACLGCGEAFAGAPERLAQRQAEQQHQERVQTVSSVGGVAASFLGAMAGSALTSGGGYSSHGYGYGGEYERRHHDIPGGGGFFGGGVSGGDLVTGELVETDEGGLVPADGVLEEDVDDTDEDDDSLSTDDADTDQTDDADDTDDSDDGSDDSTDDS
jgi:hypothetical protein